jgi:hypothetical protein
MAFKNFTEKMSSLNRDVIKLSLAVPTNGAAVPTASGIRGLGYTVTWAATGIYTFTPVSGLKMPVLLGISAHLRLNAVGNTFAQVGTFDSATGVFTVRCVSGTGVAAEWPAANANNVLSVEVTLSNSSQLPNRS